MFSRSRYILVIGLTLMFTFGLRAEEDSGFELPKYCDDHPVIEGDLEEYKQGLSSRSGEVSHTLCNNDQEYMVGVTDILDHWSDVQEAQYDDRVEAFEEKLRKKVFRAVAMSASPYRDVVGSDCREEEFASGRNGRAQRERCYNDWSVAPNCNNAEYQEIFEEVDNDYASFREQEASNLIQDDEEVNLNPEQVDEEVLLEANELLDERKKLNFIKKHVENSLVLSALKKEIEQAEETYESERRSTILSGATVCTCSGPGPMGTPEGCAECRRIKSETEDRLDTLKNNHNHQMAALNQSLNQLYQQTPSLFEMEGMFWSTDLEKSDYANKLESEFISENPEASDMSVEDVAELLSTQEGQEKLAESALSISESSDREFESLAEEKVSEEIVKKRELLEDLCKGDVDNLHHFQGLVEQIMAESMEEDQRSDLVSDQAAYCYMLQAQPPDDEGGLGTKAMIAGFALMGVGIAVNVIPFLGQGLSVATFATAGALTAGVGGGILAADSIDRYMTSADQYRSTQAAYHGSNSWASASDLIEKRDDMMQNRTMAVAETALVAADGVLMVRPALSLAARLSRKGIETSRTARQTGARVADGQVTQNAEEVTSSPDLPRNQPPSSRNGDQDSPRPGETPDSPTTAPRSTVDRDGDFFSEFRSRPLNERRQFSEDVVRRLKSAEDVSEEDFMTLIMQKGTYGSAFTSGVQDMSRRLFATLDEGRDAAQRVLDDFFAGKNSRNSDRRREQLQAMMDDVFESRAANSPATSPRPRGARSTADETTDTANLAEDFSLSARAADDSTVDYFNFDLVDSYKNGGFTNRARSGLGLNFGQGVAHSLFNTDNFWDLDLGTVEDEDVEYIDLNIRVVGGDINDLVEMGSDQFDFEVEASLEDEAELPAGSYEWECLPPDNDEELCEDVNFSETGKSQSVTLFERVPYVLKVDYVLEDPSAHPNIRLNPLSISLEMKCETNESGTQCVSDDDDSRDTASSDEDNIEQERIREPFWWEDLPPNAPPPQFRPGPPMQMRTFILPGAV